VSRPSAELRSWRVSEALWARLASLVPGPERSPERVYRRQAGAGRPPLDPRRVFEGILFVLRTGVPWKGLPRGVFGSPSSIHAHFRRWEAAGFFAALWQAGLAECEELRGIAWSWRHPDEGRGRATRASVLPRSGSLEKGMSGGSPASEERIWGPALPRRRRAEGKIING
jgi:transposase